MSDIKTIPVRLYEAGFKGLVSVIPPDAPLSPNSRIKPDQRGKTPGRRNQNGTWGGYDWLKHEASLREVRAWADANANVGLKAEYFPGVDIDTLDPELASMVARIAREVLGPAPERIGKWPKRLLMYKTFEPFARMAVIINIDGVKHLVEVLGTGRQYLVFGVHPCGSPYKWDADLPTQFNKLTEIKREHVERFFQVLEETLTLFGYTVERVGDGKAKAATAGDQTELLAPSIEALQECVAVIPNVDTDRDAYIKMGYAIRAAAGEDSAAGLDVFMEWAGRYEGTTSDAGTSEDWKADWLRMYPPYSVGWNWLAEQAAIEGFDKAKYDFDAVEDAKAPEDTASADAPTFSDQWLADQVYEECGQHLRYVAATDRWYVWDGTRWAADAVLLADTMILRSLRRLANLVLQRGATQQQQNRSIQQADRIASSAALSAVRTILRADPRVAAPVAAFDADPMILNTPGGAVDLRTGTLLPHDPARMCSRRVVATPEMTRAPRWERFLFEATNGNVAVIEYLQRLAGYALTGEVSEQMLAFIWGPGGNGKGVFMNTLQYVLQDYAETAPLDTFTAAANDRHPTDLAGLVGARLVVASETQAGRRWDEQRVKAITGGDPIRARYMRQDFFTYTPQFTLVFVGNHKPEITHLDDAMRRRIHMVPFTFKPQEVDPILAERLREEAPAILGWMLVGCAAWQNEGLNPPATVIEATRAYFEDEDSIGSFLATGVEASADAVTPVADIYRAWSEWANGRGERVGTLKLFTQRLQAHGLARTKVKGQTCIVGVTVRNPFEESV